MLLPRTEMEIGHLHLGAYICIYIYLYLSFYLDSSVWGYTIVNPAAIRGVAHALALVGLGGLGQHPVKLTVDVDSRCALGGYRSCGLRCRGSQQLIHTRK
jgi:hypothetical protein